MANTNTATGGVGFGGFLALLFITLRLCGVIHWAWYWVLAPLWIPIAIIGGVLMFIIGGPLLAGLLGLLYYWVKGKLFKKG